MAHELDNSLPAGPLGTKRDDSVTEGAQKMTNLIDIDQGSPRRVHDYGDIFMWFEEPLEHGSPPKQLVGLDHRT
jgi:hypothetical protein